MGSLEFVRRNMLLFITDMFPCGCMQMYVCVCCLSNTQGVTRTHVQRMSETRATGVRVEQKALYHVARHALMRMNTLCRSIRCRILCIDVSYATVCCIIRYSSL